MMSWWSSWWTPTPQQAHAKPRIAASLPTTEEMVENLNDTVDNLRHKRIVMLQKCSKLEREAKELHSNGKTAQAKACLKRKTIFQNQANQLEVQIGNMEQTLMAVESTATGIDVAHSMRDGANTMKSLLKETSVDEVHDAAETLEEAMAEATEVMDAVSRPIQMGNKVDEDELEAEMASWSNNGDGNDNEKLLHQLNSLKAPEESEKPHSNSETNEPLTAH